MLKLHALVQLEASICRYRISVYCRTLIIILLMVTKIAESDEAGDVYHCAKFHYDLIRRLATVQ